MVKLQQKLLKYLTAIYRFDSREKKIYVCMKYFLIIYGESVLLTNADSIGIKRLNKHLMDEWIWSEMFRSSQELWTDFKMCLWYLIVTSKLHGLVFKLNQSRRFRTGGEQGKSHISLAKTTIQEIFELLVKLLVTQTYLLSGYIEDKNKKVFKRHPFYSASFQEYYETMVILLTRETYPL